ncbi:phage tail assembly chaperone [Parasphingopyxis algicola]|uniref:phage tail assembly chaperone n=1 Tax=Parasphingopyxis algicola TaxID=2026624 RepID=UPI0015A3F71B|nr:phage tail assembly chaperone [Parasphingopyxis algicola]QLC23659.1 phage tail assembly chaperone [Parasphingopyxis algicola]
MTFSALDSRPCGHDEEIENFTVSATRLAGLAGAMLGWRPGEFWTATPAELATVLMVFSDDRAGGAPATRSDFARLMERFPDER